MLRYSELLFLGLIIAAVVVFDAPRLMAPAFLGGVILCSIDRRRRGIWPWTSRKS